MLAQLVQGLDGSGTAPVKQPRNNTRARFALKTATPNAAAWLVAVHQARRIAPPQNLFEQLRVLAPRLAPTA